MAVTSSGLEEDCAFVVAYAPPSSSVEQLCDQYSEVFQDELGTIRDFQATQKIDEQAPKLFKARTVPYSVHEGASLELDRLVESKMAIL